MKNKNLELKNCLNEWLSDIESRPRSEKRERTTYRIYENNRKDIEDFVDNKILPNGKKLSINSYIDIAVHLLKKHREEVFK